MANLSCKGIALSYGGQSVLNGVSFSFPSSGLVSIFGKSGCGKSSLLHILETLEKPNRGEVFYDGLSVYHQSASYRRNLRRKEFGIVFQHYDLLEDFDCLYNVTLPLLLLGYSKKKAEKEARKLFSTFLMEPFLHKKVKNLSGGEKQRIALLRCFIKKPSVIFADEPTGALDPSNGLLVMKMLSSYSKKSLVLLVSHNKELVDAFSSIVIHLQEGKISDVEKKGGIPLKISEQKPSFPYKRTYLFALLRRNLRDDYKRNIFCFLSGILGFSSFLLSIGYLSSNGPSLNEEMRHSLEYNYAYLSRNESLSLGQGPLRLTKSFRPTLEQCHSLFQEEEVAIYDDLSYFLPFSSAVSISSKNIAASVLPCFLDINKQSDGRLTGTYLPSFDLGVCYVNSAFLEVAPSLSLGEIIDVNSEIEVTHFGVADKVSLSLNLKVVGIYKEFSFLNTPKVYYSYLALEKELSGINLENIGKRYGESVSALDYLRLVSDDDPASRFDRIVVARGKEKIEKIFDIVEKSENYSLTSFPNTAKTSFASLSEAFSMCLLYLLGISSLCLFLLLGLNGYAGLMKRKKEVAILGALGGNNGDMVLLFCLESALICMGSALIAAVISPLLSRLASNLLESRFGLAHLFALPTGQIFGVKGLLWYLLFGFALLSSLLPSFSSVYALSRFSLAKELSEE